MANDLTIDIPDINVNESINDITKIKDNQWWKIGLGVGGGLLGLIIIISIFSIIKSIIIGLIIIVVLLLLIVIGFIIYRSFKKEMKKNTR